MEGLLSGLTRVWMADMRGRVLLIGWATTFVGVTTRAFLQKRKNKKVQAAQQQAAKGKDASKPAGASPIKTLLRRAIPGWKSSPVLWGLVLSVGIGLRIVVSIKVSSEVGVLGSLLAQRRWEELFARQLGYALYGLPAALLTAFQKYAAANVQLSLRTNLMRKIHAGLGGAASLPRVYEQAAPSSKDGAGGKAAAATEGGGGGGGGAAGAAAAGDESAVQLATSDVAKFCAEAVTLYESLLKPTLEVMILSGTLGSMMGASPLMQCYGYFFAAGMWTRFVAPAFATMTEAVQQAEGTLLDGHTRLHGYAEEVAMLGGTRREAAALDGDLATLRSASATLSLQRFVSESIDGYVLRYLGILSAFTAMLPAVYHGVGARANEDPTEYFLTCLHLLVNVGMALRDLVGSFKVAATARGYATRVQALCGALDEVGTSSSADATVAAAASASGASAGALLELEGLCVDAPDGAALIRDLSLRVAKGQRVMLTGPNGTGKSSLLRVLAGVWPAAGGKVKAFPPRDAVAFVPQRAYVPERRSVRATLAYPGLPDTVGLPADDKMASVIKWAGLDEVLQLNAAGGLAAALDAPVGKLSGGEMQRLALARIVLRPPRLAILDEASANLEAAFESKFFEWCASQPGLTVLTISHNAAVAKHHTHELRLSGAGKSTLKSL